MGKSASSEVEEQAYEVQSDGDKEGSLHEERIDAMGKLCKINIAAGIPFFLIGILILMPSTKAGLRFDNKGVGIIPKQSLSQKTCGAMSIFDSPYLVKDIHPTGSSEPFGFCSVNDLVFFTADDGSNGYELWKSNGTVPGTMMVKDINPGSGSSDIWFCISFDEEVYFSADDGINGKQLWKSDGTDTGTVLVKDIQPSGWRNEWVILGDYLYFSADDRYSGMELWRSDGTEVGTQMVMDINPTGASNPQFLTEMNNALYFSADDGLNGGQLWKSDGTNAGTVMVKEIENGGISAGLNAWMYTAGDTLYFTPGETTHGVELWKSDGTEAGTQLVKDINPGTDWGLGLLEQLVANLNDIIYFNAFDGIHSIELWRSDGTDSGTEMLMDINPTGSSLWLQTGSAVIDEILFFTPDDGVHGVELWRTDGAGSGTVMVKDINPSGSSEFSNFIVVGDYLLFSAQDGSHGLELWLSDGTESGTEMVSDINPGDSWGLSRANMVVSGSYLYFAADDGIHGMELWALPLGFMTKLSLSGAAEGEPGVDYSFIASVGPLDAGIPITYKWQVTEQEDIIHIGDVSDTVDFKWTTPGTKIVSVTVNNGVSELREQIVINISKSNMKIFIPILVSKTFQ